MAGKLGIFRAHLKINILKIRLNRLNDWLGELKKELKSRNASIYSRLRSLEDSHRKMDAGMDKLIAEINALQTISRMILDKSMKVSSPGRAYHMKYQDRLPEEISEEARQMYDEMVLQRDKGSLHLDGSPSDLKHFNALAKRMLNSGFKNQ